MRARSLSLEMETKDQMMEARTETDDVKNTTLQEGSSILCCPCGLGHSESDWGPPKGVGHLQGFF